MQRFCRGNGDHDHPDTWDKPREWHERVQSEYPRPIAATGDEPPEMIDGTSSEETEALYELRAERLLHFGNRRHRSIFVPDLFALARHGHGNASAVTVRKDRPVSTDAGIMGSAKVGRQGRCAPTRKRLAVTRREKASFGG